MDRNDYVLFKKDVSEAYKVFIKPIYVKYGQMLSTAEIRELVTYQIVQHNHEALMNLVCKRKHRKLKTKLLEAELCAAKNRNVLSTPELVLEHF